MPYTHNSPQGSFLFSFEKHRLSGGGAGGAHLPLALWRAQVRVSYGPLREMQERCQCEAEMRNLFSRLISERFGESRASSGPQRFAVLWWLGFTRGGGFRPPPYREKSRPRVERLN